MKRLLFLILTLLPLLAFSQSIPIAIPLGTDLNIGLKYQGLETDETGEGVGYYYFSNDGNDANNGQTAETSKETITELNSLTLVPGDSILFNRGDIFSDEGIIISQSGTIGDHITFTSYGIGVKPNINFTTNTAQPVINGIGESYITIAGLEITHHHSVYDYETDAALKSGIYFGDDNGTISHDWIIMDCDIHNIPFAGIIGDTNAYNIIIGDTSAVLTATSLLHSNHVYDIGHEGVTLMGRNAVTDSSNFKVYYNYIHDIRSDTNDLYLNSSSYGIKFTAEATSDGHPSYCYAKYNKITDVDTWTGIDVHGGKYIYIQDNYVYNCDVGIGAQAAVVGALTTLLDSCFIEDNIIESPGDANDTISYFISISGNDTDYPVTNGFVRDNTIFYTSRPTAIEACYAISSHISDTIVIDGNIIYNGPTVVQNAIYVSADSLIVSNNRIDDWGVGVYAVPGAVEGGWSIYNNLINATSRSIFLLSTLSSGYSLDIHNNTLIAQGDGSTRVMDATSLTVADGSVYNLKNNIISFYPTTSTKQYMSTPLTIVGTCDIDYNLYWNSTYGWPFEVSGVNMFDWAGYMAGTAYDENSPTPANPLFNDVPTNLRVGSSSPAIGSGVDIVGYLADYDGEAVSSPPNIGAYETSYSSWILSSGFWNDAGLWDDNALWID